MPANCWVLLLKAEEDPLGTAESTPGVCLSTRVKLMSEKNCGSKLPIASSVRVWSMAVSYRATRMSRLFSTTRCMISWRVSRTVG